MNRRSFLKSMAFGSLFLCGPMVTIKLFQDKIPDLTQDLDIPQWFTKALRIVLPKQFQVLRIDQLHSMSSWDLHIRCLIKGPGNGLLDTHKYWVCQFDELGFRSDPKIRCQVLKDAAGAILKAFNFKGVII